jgi:peptidoglycan L-alanyl-D-glutamate endopeptidase CwlK
MGFELTERDKSHLKKLHPDLARVVQKTAATWPHKNQIFLITCSLRTLAEQQKLVAAGASHTLKSRHLPGKTNKLSHAVDLAIKLDGKLRWDWPLYKQMANTLLAVAKAEKVPVEWGGSWTTFKDGPHFQLPWDKYPG